MNLTRPFILWSPRSASPSFNSVLLSLIQWRIFLSRLISSLAITVERQSGRSPSFSFECISNLTFRKILLELDIGYLLCRPLRIFELSDLILDISKNLVAFPCCLFNWIVFPFYQIQCLPIEYFFVENLFDLKVILVLKVHKIWRKISQYKLY